jgi:hypothetical protein
MDYRARRGFGDASSGTVPQEPGAGTRVEPAVNGSEGAELEDVEESLPLALDLVAAMPHETLHSSVGLFSTSAYGGDVCLGAAPASGGLSPKHNLTSKPTHKPTRPLSHTPTH